MSRISTNREDQIYARGERSGQTRGKKARLAGRILSNLPRDRARLLLLGVTPQSRSAAPSSQAVVTCVAAFKVASPVRLPHPPEPHGSSGVAVAHKGGGSDATAAAAACTSHSSGNSKSAAAAAAN